MINYRNYVEINCEIKKSDYIEFKTRKEASNWRKNIIQFSQISIK